MTMPPPPGPLPENAADQGREPVVPYTDSATNQRPVDEPTAGQMGYIPPYFKNPKFDTLKEGYGTPGPNM